MANTPIALSDTFGTTTPLELITGALRNINALEAGETPDNAMAADALLVLNDLLESWTIERLFIFARQMNTYAWQPGKFRYTIGNQIVGTFTGVLTAGSTTVTGVTVIPAGMTVGSMVVDGPEYGGQGALPVQRRAVQITAINQMAGTITLSQAPTVTPAVSPSVLAYSVVGDIAYDMVDGSPIALPARITNAWTRITVGNGGLVQGLDYQIRLINADKYAAIGLKALPGPWPSDMYYNRQYPIGEIFIYPNPSMAGVLNLWQDSLLKDITTLQSPLDMTQGYSRAVKTNLAIELAAEYGKAVSPLLARRARESKAAIKSLNAIPAVEAFFEQHILKSRRYDAGWILNGGFLT